MNTFLKGVGATALLALSCSEHIPQVGSKLAKTWNLEARAINKISEKVQAFLQILNNF